MSQTWRAKEKSKSNERNHQPPPDSIYNQKCWVQEKSTCHNEQDQRHVSHAKKKKKEVEHDDQAGTHDKGAQQEP